MRETLASSTFVTHTAPFAERHGGRTVPDADRLADDLVRLRVDPRDRPGERVRDPDVAGAVGDPAGPSPTWIVSADSCESSVDARRRCSPSALVTQIASSPAATRVGVGTSVTSSSIAPVAGSTTPTEFALNADERAAARAAAEGEHRDRDRRREHAGERADHEAGGR